jgi:hypothetical protein
VILLRFCKLKDYNLLGMKDAFRKKTLRRFCGDFAAIFAKSTEI